MKVAIWTIVVNLVMPCLGMKRILFNLNELPQEEPSNSSLESLNVIHSVQADQSINSSPRRNTELATGSAVESIAFTPEIGPATTTALSSPPVTKGHHILTNGNKRQCLDGRVHFITKNSPNQLTNRDQCSRSTVESSITLSPTTTGTDARPRRYNGVLANLNCAGYQYPGLKLVDFPPSHLDHPDHKIAFEAIRSLKLKDGKLFFERNYPDFGKSLKIPYLYSSIEFTSSYHVIKSTRTSETLKGGQIQIAKRKSLHAQWKANAAFQMEKIDMVKNYGNLVREDFAQKINDFRTKLKAKENVSQRELIQFTKIVEILPLYSFHVDLINTMMGVGTVIMKDATGLQAERKLAGTTVFDLMEVVFFPQDYHGPEIMDTASTMKAIKSANNTGEQGILRSPFLWVILSHWSRIRGSRSTYPWPELNTSFKGFINDITKCFMEKFSVPNLKRF